MEDESVARKGYGEEGKTEGLVLGKSRIKIMRFKLFSSSTVLKQTIYDHQQHPFLQHTS